jgi:hypothetical protein
LGKGKRRQERRVRRSCSITAGYELDSKDVEKALLEAASKVEAVLKDPTICLDYKIWRFRSGIHVIRLHQ